MHACVAEFLGTALLILLGNGVVANVVLDKTKGHGSGWIVISFGWAMAVFVGVWCVGPISGAHLNPAVTLGLASAGEFPWSGVAGYVAAQMFGAILGATLVFFFYRPHYEATADPDAKLATFCTAPAIRRPSANLACEVIGTAVLVLAVLLAVEPSIDLGQPLATGGGPAPRSDSAHSVRSPSACWSSRSACRSAAPRATPSTRPATWAPASPTHCCRSPTSATATGPTLGSPSRDRCSVPSLRR